MDFTGRAPEEMFYVGNEGFAEDRALADWLEIAVDSAGSRLPRRQ